MQEEAPQAENIPAETETAVEASPATEAAPAAETTQPEPAQATEEKKPSRAESRIRKLSQELKDVKSKIGQGGIPPLSPLPDFPTTGEVTPEQYKAQVAQTAAAIAELKAQQVKAELRQELNAKEKIDQFTRDVTAIEQKYPELNPDSPSYDEKKSEELTRLYEESSKYNPDLGLANFVETIMNLAEGAKDQGRGEATETLAKQAAEAAVGTSPGSQKSERKFDDLSLDEMEQHLGYAKGA